MNYIWLGIMLVCLAVEALTPQLTTIWLAAGALCALIAEMIAPELLWLQILLFLTVSIIALILTRPLARRLLDSRRVALNADRNIGKRALVVAEINNIEGRGQIKVGGEIWSAVSEDGSEIAEGESVEICRIAGVKAVVKKL